VVSGVIPAQAGIQFFLAFLDSHLRGSDEKIEFFSNLLEMLAHGYLIVNGSSHSGF
jgi:hypothetical protein